jgi:hypothetical protein
MTSNVQMTPSSARNLGNALQQELRVNGIRQQLNLNNPAHLLPEFMLRREISLASAAWERGDMAESAKRWYALKQIV